jgi:mannitol-specific phosphotransferase system IIBC component
LSSESGEALSFPSPKGKHNGDATMDMIIHLLSAALLSLLISTILVITQCRHTFSQIRNAFVEHIQQRNATDTSAKQKRHPQEGTYTVAFFHPHCSSGGGGERVLWKIVEALGEMKEDASKDKKSTIADEAVRNNCRNLSVVIYTVDEPSATYGKGLLNFVCCYYNHSCCASMH